MPLARTESAPPAELPALTLDLFSDIACPWCYVGERRLAEALRQRPGVRVERRWHPFLLQPDLPRTGVPWAAFAAEKFGGAERTAAMYRHMRSAGEPAGIAFDFEAMPVAPNTRDAHRLILAASDALGAEAGFVLADRLFRAYFEEGQNVSDADTLARLAAETGLPEPDARAVLASDAFARDIDESVAAAARIGVTGVPFYIVGRRYAVSGAQPPAAFLDVIDRALAASPDATTA